MTQLLSDNLKEPVVCYLSLFSVRNATGRSWPRKLDGFQPFAGEAKIWYELLAPVLACFVVSFDSPDAPETIDFWQKVAHYSGGGSGPTYFSVPFKLDNNGTITRTNMVAGSVGLRARSNGKDPHLRPGEEGPDTLSFGYELWMYETDGEQ
ncbi:hypothetical protein N431DRAFT_562585 [Stipitochalara longipes BDJ]|nr:hypothetical protein N431DRAFT_562585 [Stipitochalara longipes BDJ]